jgi:predicted house-cleaning noncanonical NTP pyrophosphatase (MazG superfamily)
VQDPRFFFRIRPGLWALNDCRDRLPESILPSGKTPVTRVRENTHAYYQGLIAEVGAMRHMETFVPLQDKNKPFMQGTLASVTTVPAMYKFTYDETLRKAQTVDVVWFNERKMPDAFFEVENSTDMLNALSKFVQLQDFAARFFIVADTLRQREFTDKIALTAFSDVRRRVLFESYEYVAGLHAKLTELVLLEQGEEQTL